MNIDVKHSNNYVVAKFLFDEIILWSAKKNPNKSLESFLTEIEKLFDKIEERGYNKGKEQGYYRGLNEANF